MLIELGKFQKTMMSHTYRMDIPPKPIKKETVDEKNL